MCTENDMKLATHKTVMSAACLAVFAGCGTVHEAYKPDHLGNLADNETNSGIEVTLSPDKYRARIGDPVTFQVVIRNVGDTALWFPADPDLLLTWVYPDGKRDNLIRGDRREAVAGEVLLSPGQERIEHSVVTTYYFDRGGIHEFRAIVTADAGPVGKKPTWHGRAVSNGFGVYFEEN